MWKTLFFLGGVAILSLIGERILPVLGYVTKLSALAILAILGYMLYKKLFG